MSAMGPKKDSDGILAITMSMGNKKLPGIGAEDIGKCSCGIFRKGTDFIGKTVGIAGEHLTGIQMAAALRTVMGQTVGYNAVEPQLWISRSRGSRKHVSI